MNWVRRLSDLREKPNIKFHCFWCNVFLLAEEVSSDHVIPQWMNGRRTVICCIPCNIERSHISTIASFGNRRKSKKRVSAHKIRQRCEALMPLIEKYRTLIEQKLEGDEREVCLRELDMAENKYKDYQ